MKILLDECLPKKLKILLDKFEVKTVNEMGWNSFKNGKLLKVAVENSFDILLTIDKNLEFQLNLKFYNITIVVFNVQKSKIEYITPLVSKFIDKISKFEKRKAYIIT